MLENARPPDGPSWRAGASCLGDVCVLSAQSGDADGGDLGPCPTPAWAVLAALSPVSFPVSTSSEKGRVGAA